MPKGSARLSQVETHPERARIELDLARGVTCRAVAVKYGISKSTVHRWLKKMPPQLKVAALRGKVLAAGELEKLRIDESEGILQNLAMQRARLLLSQDMALEIPDHDMVARLSGQIHKNIELTGKYLGEFARHVVQTNVNVLIQPEYLELRSKIVKALAPFPEARRAVAEVLHEIEGRAAASNAPPPSMIEGQAQHAA